MVGRSYMVRGTGKKMKSERKSGATLSRSSEVAFAPHRNGMEPAEADRLRQENESLRTRLSKLSEASRRVSETMDRNTVLQEVIDSSRSLTGARYGALLTYEQSGAMRDLIISGLPSLVAGVAKKLLRGSKLLALMDDVTEPLRLSDVSSHATSLGLPAMKTFLGMPIRHHGELVGHIFLTVKRGGQEFTSEDQDVLVLFASQAGAAILNARRYREEHQARVNLEVLLALSPVGMLVVDALTRNVLSVNKEAHRIIGVQPGITLEQFRAESSYSRPDGRKLPIEEHPLQIALNGADHVQPEEVVFQLPDGRETTCLINASVIRSPSGEVVSAIGTVQDLTPLEEMKRQRAEFLSTVSHELRTPLSAVKGSTSTLLNSSYPLAPAETRQFLRVIDEQSDHMRQLINDLIDMTHIEAGTLSVDPEPIDSSDLLNEARETHVEWDGSINCVELALPPDLPMVVADRRRILQVLGNLIERACNYSSNPTIARISALPRATYLAVTVENQGAGPGVLRHPHETQRLSIAVDEVAARRNGRDGVSLAICKGIVEAHGGRLSVGEGEDGGGRFTFTIPLAKDAEDLAGHGSDGSPSARDSEGGRGRILAVVETPETVRYVRSILSQAGFDALVTGNADQMHNLLEVEKPHVVLLDPDLPWADGLEMLRSVGRVSDAPVIFVAGHGWDQHIGRAFEHGAFDYIAKPFTSTELLARIDVAIRRRSAGGLDVPPDPYRYKDLTIDYLEREVTVSGHPVHLTATEYKLLTELSKAAGRVLTHEQLLRRVWGPLYSSDSRIVRTYVKELRHKLGDDASRPTYIFTEPGVGYRMARPSTA